MERIRPCPTLDFCSWSHIEVCSPLASDVTSSSGFALATLDPGTETGVSLEMQPSMSPTSSIDPLPLASRLWPGPAPTVMLIHGVGDGAFVWDAFLSRLLLNNAALTLDLRGHGDSPWDPRRDYRTEAHVADVAALLDRLGPARLVLLGHSLGAEVAILAAAERPHRVSGLIVVDGGPELNPRAALAVMQHLKTLAWCYPTVADFTARLVDRHPLADRSVLERYASSALRHRVDTGFELKADPALRLGRLPPDEAAMWRALDTLACPKLIVRGAASSLLSQQNAERTSQRVSDCRLATVPRAGHSVPLDNPAGLHDAVRPFLAEVASAACSD